MPDEVLTFAQWGKRGGLGPEDQGVIPESGKLKMDCCFLGFRPAWSTRTAKLCFKKESWEAGETAWQLRLCTSFTKGPRSVLRTGQLTCNSRSTGIWQLWPKDICTHVPIPKYRPTYTRISEKWRWKQGSERMEGEREQLSLYFLCKITINWQFSLSFPLLAYILAKKNQSSGPNEIRKKQ